MEQSFRKHPTSNRLTGRKLLLMRLLWVVAATVFVSLYLLALPQSLHKAFADLSSWRGIVTETFYLVLGLVLFWVRSDDWVACIFSLLLMPFLMTGGFVAVFGSGLITERLALVVAAINSTLLLCLFYIFPDGRFVPRWTRWAVLAAAGVQIWRVFFEDAYMARGFAMVAVFMIIGAFAQVYRYHRWADELQRQQIKWVAFGLAITLLPLGIVVLVSTGQGNLLDSDSIVSRIGGFLWGMFVVVFPLSIVVSVFRYRLWDIDVIIRKTLHYTAVTALLALIYFGSVFLLQRLFSSLTGQQSPLVLVVSTLLIAAIFAPLRRRVQEGIDRRFYRKKYDAQQVLAQFARTARDETDMDSLVVELERGSRIRYNRRVCGCG